MRPRSAGCAARGFGSPPAHDEHVGGDAVPRHAVLDLLHGAVHAEVVLLGDGEHHELVRHGCERDQTSAVHAGERCGRAGAPVLMVRFGRNPFAMS